MNCIRVNTLLFFAIIMTCDIFALNPKLMKIQDDLLKCIPDSIINRIHLVEENDFINGRITSDIRILEFESALSYFRCVDDVKHNYYENLDICKSFFPYTICSRFPVFTIELILKSIHRKATNKPYDMQHDIDSIMTMLNTLDSVRAYKAVADTINGVYIPRDIEEALEILVDYLQHPNDIAEIKSKTEDEFAGENYFGLGLMIRNSWLWHASRLQIYIELISGGIDHPDEQSVILMRFLHRKLNGKPLDKWKLFESEKKQKDKD